MKKLFVVDVMYRSVGTGLDCDPVVGNPHYEDCFALCADLLLDAGNVGRPSTRCHEQVEKCGWVQSEGNADSREASSDVGVSQAQCLVRSCCGWRGP